MVRLRFIALAMLSICGIQLFGVEDPFVGTWVLNSEKSIFEGTSSLPMKVALEIKRGDSGILIIDMTGFGKTRNRCKSKSLPDMTAVMAKSRFLISFANPRTHGQKQ